jgi:hypothetical protein
VPTSIPVKITEHDHKEFSDSGVAIDNEIREIRQNFNVALVNTSMTDQYNKEHAKLLRAEDENAWDRAVRNSLDPYEEKAAVIIGAIREFERNVIFGNLASEAIPGENTRDMGGQYLTNKKRIDHGSLLYQIAVKVPKGGLLHLHFNAELHPERLLVQARDIEDMYIWSMRPFLNYKDLDETEVVLNVLDSGKVEKGVDSSRRRIHLQQTGKRGLWRSKSGCHGVSSKKNLRNTFRTRKRRRPRPLAPQDQPAVQSQQSLDLRLN